MDLSIFCLLPIIFIGNFPPGEALDCYQCNSGKIYDGAACEDLVPNSEGSAKYIQNCSDLSDGKEYKRCRIMVQDVEGDFRIVRSCATWPDLDKPNRCVDRTGTNKIKVRYCECAADKCNGSSRIYGSVFILLATVIGLLFANSMYR